MGYGLRSALRLAATVAAAAAVARAADSAKRFFEQVALQAAAERPALPQVSAAASPLSVGAVPEGSVLMTPPEPHPFGPTPSVVPARGIGFRTTAPPPTRAQAPGGARRAQVISEPTPIDRLRARRNADHATPVSAPDEPTPEPPRTEGRHRRDVEADTEADTGTRETELTMSVPLTSQAPVTLRLAVGPQNTLTVTVSLPGATVEEPP